MDTKQGAKPIPVKVDPTAEVNTIPLSQYRKLFKKNFTKAGNIKNNVLHPTSHLWSSHDSKPQQFWDTSSQTFITRPFPRPYQSDSTSSKIQQIHQYYFHTQHRKG